MRGKRRKRSENEDRTAVRRPDKVLITDYLTEEDIDNLRTVPYPNKEKSPDFCHICDTKFSSAKELTRHLTIKRDCKGTSGILAKNFLKSQMILVCPNETCCYSTRDLRYYKEHLYKSHNIFTEKKKNKGEDNTKVTVYSLLSQDEISDVMMCDKCLGRYASKEAYNIHRKRCSGKQSVF